MKLILIPLMGLISLRAFNLTSIINPSIDHKNLNEFLNNMAEFESRNDYLAKNKFGMLGKYQFSFKTIQNLHIKTTPVKFLHDPALQDKVMIKYLKNNSLDLKPVIRKFSGKYYHNIYITKSGILAAAHFAGSSNVINFFKHYNHIKDANGASIVLYMKKFSGYNLKGI